MVGGVTMNRKLIVLLPVDLVCSVLAAAVPTPPRHVEAECAMVR